MIPNQKHTAINLQYIAKIISERRYIMITVSKDHSGDFHTIQSAVDSLCGIGGIIYIKNGIYKERVEITTDHVMLIGESAENTIITNDYSASMLMEDGSKRGTFRSYTFFVHADDFHAFHITFENSAGFGKEVGQAIAVYAEGDRITFKNCRILGHQDTLFTGPLPKKENVPGGFIGPTEFCERTCKRQLYEDCYISGEVDFIFGSATAFFKNCELYALDRKEPINCYYTAPSTYKEQKYGYVFQKCKLTGNCPDKTVMLSRPWRIYAKAVFIQCEMSGQITDIGFHDWNKPESHETCFYAEYKCFGEGYKPASRPSYIHQLTDSEALEYTKENVLGF